MNETTESNSLTDIVTEVQHVKEFLFEAHGSDLHRMFEDMRRAQETSGHQVIPRVGRIREPEEAST